MPSKNGGDTTASRRVHANALGRRQRIDRLLRLIEEHPDSTRRELADALGVNWNRVSDYVGVLKREGRLPQGYTYGSPYEPKPRPRKVSRSIAQRERMEKVYTLIQKGVLDRGDLADRVGVSRSTVNTYLRLMRERGILPRDFDLSREAQKKEAKVRYLDILTGISIDLTQAEIAERIGVEAGQVSRDLGSLRRAQDPNLELAYRIRAQVRKWRRHDRLVLRKRGSWTKPDEEAQRLRDATGLTPVDLSRRNLAIFYRDELVRLLRGERVTEVFGDNIRRQLRAYGLIERIRGVWRPAARWLGLAGVEPEVEISFGKRP